MWFSARWQDHRLIAVALDVEWAFGSVTGWVGTLRARRRNCSFFLQNGTSWKHASSRYFVFRWETLASMAEGLMLEFGSEGTQIEVVDYPADLLGHLEAIYQGTDGAAACFSASATSIGCSWPPGRSHACLWSLREGPLQAPAARLGPRSGRAR